MPVGTKATVKSLHPDEVRDLGAQILLGNMGISRVKVNRLLAEARESGIVKISIEHRFARMAEVEENIRRRYNLSFCRTSPPLMSYFSNRKKTPAIARESPDESSIARRAVGIVAANLLRERLQADETSVIGVGWGRTIAEVPNYLVGMSKPRAKFVSVMGSLTRSSAANLFEVVYHFAERTGGEGHFLPVPFIANTIADREIFMSQRVYKEILALAGQVIFYMDNLRPVRRAQPLVQASLPLGYRTASSQARRGSLRLPRQIFRCRRSGGGERCQSEDASR